MEQEMQKAIYLDHAATTALSRTALDAMLPFLTEEYGNPSSLHTAGQKAKEALETAREELAEMIGATAREITFTSGGSEGDNQALRTAAVWGKKQGKTHIISTAFEHHAVLHTLEQLGREGFEITLLDVHESGLVSAEEVRAAIRPDTCLVSVMYANNEIGTVQPIAEIGAVCREAGVLFHTDAVQAAGHLPIDVKAQQVDLLTISAHKFRGPKGVGLLYCRKGIPLVTLVEGGAQERGKRAGTENVAGIVGMAAALRDALDHMEENAAYIGSLREQIIEGLSKIPHCALNGDRSARLPGNVSFCFEGIEGEALLLLLDMKGIYASSGSACTSGSLEPSHVLLAIGRPHEVAHGSLRLTLDASNTEEDVEAVLRWVPWAVDRLRGMSPVWKKLEAGEQEFLL